MERYEIKVIFFKRNFVEELACRTPINDQVLRLTPEEQVLKGAVFDAEKAVYSVVELMINGTYGFFIQAASTAMIGEFQMMPVNQEHITYQLS